MLTSTHLERWARLLAEYAVEARAGQVVRISAQPAGEPLLEAVYRAVLETGAHPIVRMQPESLEEIFYDVANEAQLDWENPFNAYETERIDASINIRTSINLRAMDHVDPARSQRAARARAGERSLFFDRAALADAPELAPGGSPLRWSMTQFPTNAYAQFAGMSLKEYEGFVVKACQLDQPDPIAFWQSLDAWQIQLAEVLNGGRELHFKAPTGTDLRVAVDGMRWLSSPGRKNFPDGEVYSGPNLKADNGGAEGVVVFDRSTVYQGHRVSDVRIRMEQGRATEVTAGEGEAFLVKMLDQDEGARRIGEVAFGTNRAITQTSGQILYDEKMGGSFHMAFGAGFPETGNRNQSALHWDLIGSLGEGSLVTLDGAPFCVDGAFVNLPPEVTWL